jgi:cell division protein FtsQ
MPPRVTQTTKRRPAPKHPPRLRWAVRGLGIAITGGFVAWVLLSGTATRMAEAAGHDLIASSAALGFRVQAVTVEGRVETDAQEILRAIGVARGDAILGFSPETARRTVEQIPWVASATVARRLPDTVHVSIVERRPIALWQINGKLSLIDRDGTDLGVPAGGLEEFRELPLVVGPDAPRHAQALFETLKSVPDVAKHVTAMVRVGSRRWDLQLDNGMDVKLPEDDVAGALAAVAAAAANEKLLERDVRVVDLRLPGKMVLQQNEQPSSGKSGTDKKDNAKKQPASMRAGERI